MRYPVAYKALLTYKSELQNFLLDLTTTDLYLNNKALLIKETEQEISKAELEIATMKKEVK